MLRCDKHLSRRFKQQQKVSHVNILNTAVAKRVLNENKIEYKELALNSNECHDVRNCHGLAITNHLLI